MAKVTPGTTITWEMSRRPSAIISFLSILLFCSILLNYCTLSKSQMAFSLSITDRQPQVIPSVEKEGEGIIKPQLEVITVASKPPSSKYSPRVITTNEKAYIDRFHKVAISEQKKFGVPASVTLAQGLLESNRGESPLAKNDNNHFGIKCHSKKCAAGHCSNYSDDSHKDFFRTYKTAWESYRAHSKLLQGSRYRHLKDFGTDYRKWAEGLQKAGYATDKGYSKKLIRLIEELSLYSYDS